MRSPAAWGRALAVASLVLLGLVVTMSTLLYALTPPAADVQQRVVQLVAADHSVLLLPGQVPRELAQAVVATEDERFYAHHGIDGLGLLRAASDDLSKRCLCEGGSTITEQLVKVVYLGGSDAGLNKLEDVVIAFKVESVLGKDRIMADYLSVAPTGLNRYGMFGAACAYFHAPLSALGLAPLALLAGLPQAPSAYDPLANPEAATDRRAQVLAAMVREKVITRQQAADAERQPLTPDLSRPGSRC